MGIHLVTHSLLVSWFIAQVCIGHSPGASSMPTTGESEMQGAPATARLPRSQGQKQGMVCKHSYSVLALLAGDWSLFLGDPSLMRMLQVFLFFG